MKTYNALMVCCGLFVMPARAQQSTSSVVGFTTSASEHHVAASAASSAPRYGAVDLRSMLAPSLGEQSIESISYGGMTPTGIVWGHVVVDDIQRGFIIGNGTVNIIGGARMPDAEGDVPVPTSYTIAGVSSAGDYVYEFGGTWAFSRASGTGTPLSVPGHPHAVALGVAPDGTIAFRSSGFGTTTFGTMNADGALLEHYQLPGYEWDYLGVGSQGSLDGSVYSFEKSGYTPFTIRDGTVRDPFSGAASQMVASSSGGWLGIAQDSSYDWPSLMVNSPGDVSMMPEGVIASSGIVVTRSERINLYDGANFVIPFALSRDARTVVGTSFASAQTYAQTGRGDFVVWRDGSVIRPEVTGAITSVHDGLGISDTGAVALKAVGADGSDTIAFAVPRVVEFAPAPSIERDDSRLTIVGADGSFSSATAEALSGKRVVVLTHGWAPGYEDAVEQNPSLRAWNANATWYVDVAKTILADDPEAVVLGFSWVDDSATETDLYPRSSRANADGAGHVLGATLAELGAGAESISVIGHSHGARVALHAAGRMEEVGVQVASLTLLDSPESPRSVAGAVTWFAGGENELAGDLAAFALRFGVGEGPMDTRVANVYASIGEAYVVPGVTNVRLTAYDSVKEGHSYPIEWLASGGTVPREIGSYVQDSGGGGTVLPVATNAVARSVASLARAMSSSLESGDVDSTSAALLFSMELLAAPTAASSLVLSAGTDSVWEALWSVPVGAECLLVPYRFIDGTDETSLAAYLNGEQGGVALYAAATYAPRRDLDPYSDDGWRVLAVSASDMSGAASIGLALTGEGRVEIGEIEVSTRQFSVAAVPEPGRASLGLIATAAALLRRRRPHTCVQNA